VFSKVRVMSSVFGNGSLCLHLIRVSGELVLLWIGLVLLLVDDDDDNDLCAVCWSFVCLGSVSKKKLGFSGCVLMCVFFQT
jgi:hypothetical protein